MTDQRQINELTARLAKLETMLQNNDAYSPPGAVKLADMDLGPGLDYTVPDMAQFMNQTQPDIQWIPEFSSEQQQLIQDENFGFGPTDSTITDLQQRINDLETFVAGGSNDTNQDGALDSDQGTADNGLSGRENLSFTPQPLEFFHSFGLTNAAYAAGTNLSFNSGTSGKGICNPYGIFSETAGVFTATRAGYVSYSLVFCGVVTGQANDTMANAQAYLMLNGSAAASGVLVCVGTVTGGAGTTTIITGRRYVATGDTLSAQLDTGGVAWTFYSSTGFSVSYIDQSP